MPLCVIRRLSHNVSVDYGFLSTVVFTTTLSFMSLHFK